MPSTDPVLRLRDVRVGFTLDAGTVRAVDGVSLDLYRGETLGIVGESGSGKSIAARSIMQLLPRSARIESGSIAFRSGASAEPVDLASLDPRGERIRSIRGNDIAMIFQEPMTSLSPVHTVGDQVSEMLRTHADVSRRQARDRAAEMLRLVEIPRPRDMLDAYPFQLSGGMRQRVMIATALMCEPAVLIADEPTTALDVTTQAQILDLLRRLQDELGMAILFITHDMGVVAEMAGRVAVMYLGRFVETADVRTLFAAPRHPYTRALLESIPAPGAPRERLRAIRGSVPAATMRPAGCSFHPRCDVAVAGRCDVQAPPLVTLPAGHAVECILADDAHGGDDPIDSATHPSEVR